MKEDQKLLLVSGCGLAIISALYIMSASIPNTKTAAILFPLSILGLFFGVVFILWSLAWLVLDKVKK